MWEEKNQTSLKTGRVTPPSISHLCITLCHKENRQNPGDKYINVMYGRGVTPQDSSLPITVKEEEKAKWGEDNC